LAEEYPDLKATLSIQDLIKEASNTEDRIAEAKKEYNKECEVYNQYLSVFPGNVFAFVYRFKPLPYIGMEEDLKVPLIDLKMREPEAVTQEELTALPNNSDKAEGAKE
jgi:LemA protein